MRRIIDIDVLEKEFKNGARDDFFFKKYRIHQSSGCKDVSAILRNVLSQEYYRKIYRQRLSALTVLSQTKRQFYEEYNPDNVEEYSDIEYDTSKRDKDYFNFFNNRIYD